MRRIEIHAAPVVRPAVAPTDPTRRILGRRNRNTALDTDRRSGPVEARSRPDPVPDAAWTFVFAGWLIAGASTLGALFVSEVMELPPCVLCWYQRIFMFPLALLLPIGLFPFDRRIVRYALPLAIGGAATASFHLLLVGGFIPESLKPCTHGVPCTEVQIQWFGFVTLPLLSLVAFALIGALLIAAHQRMSR
jgi:disulfide bond formation protein DsbB